MELGAELISELNHALPKEFDFYHMGQVRLQKEALRLKFEDQVIVGFYFQGEIKGVFLVIFDPGLDVSMYTELGNILASQVATQLEVMISPPQPVSASKLGTLIAGRNPDTMVCRSYVHFHQGQGIPVQTLIVPATSEEAGHA